MMANGIVTGNQTAPWNGNMRLLLSTSISQVSKVIAYNLNMCNRHMNMQK